MRLFIFPEFVNPDVLELLIMKYPFIIIPHYTSRDFTPLLASPTRGSAAEEDQNNIHIQEFLKTFTGLYYTQNEIDNVRIVLRALVECGFEMVKQNSSSFQFKYSYIPTNTHSSSEDSTEELLA